jgi:beta-glucosidase
LKTETLPAQAVGKSPLRVDWKGFLTVDRTADYAIGVRFDSGFAKVTVDGKDIANGWAGGDTLQTRMGHLHLEKAKKVPIEVRYSTNNTEHNRVQLIWSEYDPKPDPAAVEAAKNADVVVAVLGITSELEGEEMPVNEPGFKGGDRTVWTCRNPKKSC